LFHCLIVFDKNWRVKNEKPPTNIQHAFQLSNRNILISIFQKTRFSSKNFFIFSYFLSKNNENKQKTIDQYPIQLILLERIKNWHGVAKIAKNNHQTLTKEI
jgi:hypothetical protein